MCEGELVLGGNVALAAGYGASHIEARVALVLHVENSRAGAHGPLRTGAPGDPQAWGKVFVVAGDQPVAQAAVAGHRHRRVEQDRRVVVEAARADAYQGWMAVFRDV